MSSAQFCLSSDTFKTSICNGLTSLQQREEFVDMTLAADGHFVKVHQIIVSLASPYLKELILSAPCPHPVVFLNKISYPILCCILEYIYSGEVMVNKESLPELIAAAKELHIKGLQNMELLQSATENRMEQCISTTTLVETLNQYKPQSSHKSSTSIPERSILISKNVSKDDISYDPFAQVNEDHLNDDDDDEDMSGLQSSQEKSSQDSITLSLAQSQSNSTPMSDDTKKTVQYTLSNQGSLQLILNRFVYYLRYCHKNANPPVRMWRCVDYIKTRCPASVTTRDDIVIQRVSAHKHGFHDKKIMKKLKAGTIFTAIKDAESKEVERKNK